VNMQATAQLAGRSEVVGISCIKRFPEMVPISEHLFFISAKFMTGKFLEISPTHNPSYDYDSSSIQRPFDCLSKVTKVTVS